MYIYIEERDTLSSLERRSLPLLYIQKRDALSSAERRSLCPLYIKDRRSLLSRMSLSHPQRRETISPLQREEVSSV